MDVILIQFIVANAFTKKSQKMPKGEKALAVKAYQSYEKES